MIAFVRNDPTMAVLLAGVAIGLVMMTIGAALTRTGIMKIGFSIGLLSFVPSFVATLAEAAATRPQARFQIVSPAGNGTLPLAVDRATGCLYLVRRPFLGDPEMTPVVLPDGTQDCSGERS